MAKNKEIKTNAMRILDRMKIPYYHYTYECEEFVDGLQMCIRDRGKDRMESGIPRTGRQPVLGE